MKSESPYFYCPGGDCPMKEDCNRYKPVMDKRKTFHYAWPPLKKDGTCQEFDKKDDTDKMLEKLN